MQLPRYWLLTNPLPFSRGPYATRIFPIFRYSFFFPVSFNHARPFPSSFFLLISARFSQVPVSSDRRDDAPLRPSDVLLYHPHQRCPFHSPPSTIPTARTLHSFPEPSSPIIPFQPNTHYNLWITIRAVLGSGASKGKNFGLDNPPVPSLPS